MHKDLLIQSLGLQAHEEGGYFRQMYESAWSTNTPERDGSVRPGLNTIYYMLTDDSPIGHWHSNRSDIVHFFHAGHPIRYWILFPDGRLEQTVLGPDPTQGHCLQMTVPGGAWKASVLETQEEGTFGLLSEAVAPGFDYRDRQMADAETLRKEFPQHWDTIQPFIHNTFSR